MGLFLILIPFIANKYVNIFVPILVCLSAVSLSAFNISLMSYIQINVSKNYIGRVFSIVFSMAMILSPIGSFFFHKVIVFTMEFILDIW